MVRNLQKLLANNDSLVFILMMTLVSWGFTKKVYAGVYPHTFNSKLSASRIFSVKFTFLKCFSLLVEIPTIENYEGVANENLFLFLDIWDLCKSLVYCPKHWYRCVSFVRGVSTFCGMFRSVKEHARTKFVDNRNVSAIVVNNFYQCHNEIPFEVNHF
ncbi:hypothetical protein CHS0354_037759 [Potamilus streckersoni]|uniref:Uncharacterized protein n=1 Tax=Potamilus streckersoni TaxID=2493646 RepID=A0AAE0T3A0_9BIVA|nr:hypothetical protein CHS0354_037759 [Potamilus streckersoni]